MNRGDASRSDDARDDPTTTSISSTSSRPWRRDMYEAYYYYNSEGRDPLNQTIASLLCDKEGGDLGTIASVEDEERLKLDLSDSSWVVGKSTSRLLTGGAIRPRNYTTTSTPQPEPWYWKYGPRETVGSEISDFWGKCRQSYCNWAYSHPYIPAGVSGKYEIVSVWPPSHLRAWEWSPDTEDPSDPRSAELKFYLCQFTSSPATPIPTPSYTGQHIDTKKPTTTGDGNKGASRGGGRTRLALYLGLSGVGMFVFMLLAVLKHISRRRRLTAERSVNDKKNSSAISPPLGVLTTHNSRSGEHASRLDSNHHSKFNEGAPPRTSNPLSHPKRNHNTFSNHPIKDEDLAEMTQRTAHLDEGLLP